MRAAAGWTAWWLAAASIALPGAARADEAGVRQPPLWEIGLGVGGLRLPHYRGSDQSHFWVLPVPYVVYRGEIFKADRNGARALLLDTDRLEVDLSASASAPTRSRDNHARAGMTDLAPTVEIGPNLNWTVARGEHWKLDLRVPVRAAFTVGSDARHAGWISTPNVNLDVADWRGWNLGLLAGPVYGDRRLHGYFYGVSAADATATRPAYQARGGYAGATLTGALSRRDGARWIGLFAKFDTLAGAAFDASPLLRQRRQASFGVAVSWVFAASTRVVDEVR